MSGTVKSIVVVTTVKHFSWSLNFRVLSSTSLKLYFREAAKLSIDLFFYRSAERDSTRKTHVLGLTECTAPASDKVVFNWSIGKWDNDPDVIDRYIVYWFPYENEKAKTDKIFEIKQWDRQPNAGRFDDYEDVMVAENIKDDDFMYIGSCFTFTKDLDVA